MEPGFTIVGLGEALFDVYPDREVLGGAPLNVAVHAHQLGVFAGGDAVAVSRIGQDERGRRLLAELATRGLNPAFVQVDPTRPTGTVNVELHHGEPTYDIVRDVAWDALEWTPDLERLAGRCDAVCFGSLCQRAERSRETILRFVQQARRAVRLFDVNLRQEYYSAEIIRRSCELATAVKLNEKELPLVSRLLGLDKGDETGQADRQAAALLRAFPLEAVVLTRGAAGTVLYTAGGRVAGTPVRYEPHPDADSVGAGDACSAGLLLGLVLRWPAERVVALANHVGAFVASQPGATPTLPDAILGMVRG